MNEGKTVNQQRLLELWSYRGSMLLLRTSSAIGQLTGELKDGVEQPYAPAVRAGLISQAKQRTAAARALLAELETCLDALAKEANAELESSVPKQ